MIGEKEYLYESYTLRALEMNSVSEQIDLFIEEAAEAIQAVIHFRRDRNNEEVVCGELADLQVMLDRMRRVFGEGLFDQVLDEKYEKLRQMLDGEIDRR